MPRFALSFASLLAVLCLLACTGAATPDAPTPTPTQSIKVLESLIAMATRTPPLPPTPTPAPPTIQQGYDGYVGANITCQMHKVPISLLEELANRDADKERD